jgi:hypothetical protein
MHDPAHVLSAARGELARYPGVLDGLLGGADAATWNARPAANEWSPAEIICHLRDEEVEDFRARVQAILAGAGRFTAIEPERWAVERRYVDADGPAVLAEFERRRAASLRFLDDLTTDRLTGAAERPSAGTLSGLDLVVAWVAHDRLHLAQLAATLARTWATRWSPLRADYAGPIPY